MQLRPVDNFMLKIAILANSGQSRTHVATHVRAHARRTNGGRWLAIDCVTAEEAKALRAFWDNSRNWIRRSIKYAVCDCNWQLARTVVVNSTTHIHQRTVTDVIPAIYTLRVVFRSILIYHVWPDAQQQPHIPMHTLVLFTWTYLQQAIRDLVGITRSRLRGWSVGWSVWPRDETAWCWLADVVYACWMSLEN